MPNKDSHTYIDRQSPTAEFLGDLCRILGDVQRFCNKHNDIQMDSTARDIVTGTSKLAADAVLQLSHERARLMRAKSNVVQLHDKPWQHAHRYDLPHFDGDGAA